MEKLLNPSELADILGVQPGTVYSSISRGVDVHMLGANEGKGEIK